MCGRVSFGRSETRLSTVTSRYFSMNLVNSFTLGVTGMTRSKILLLFIISEDNWQDFEKSLVLKLQLSFPFLFNL